MTNTATWSFQMGARTLWQEARSEPIEGQRAVAHTLWNRLRTGRWGHTFAHVVHGPLHNEPDFQFSGWNANDPNLIPTLELADDDRALVILTALLATAENEPDPTGGALCYYNPKIAPQPFWAKPGKLLFRGQFGNMLYYADNPATGAKA